jgi:hypothetical protein
VSISTLFGDGENKVEFVTSALLLDEFLIDWMIFNRLCWQQRLNRPQGMASAFSLGSQPHRKSSTHSTASLSGDDARICPHLHGYARNCTLARR